MPIFTTETIDAFNVYYYTDYKNVQRGQQLYHVNQVTVTSFSGDDALFQVADKDGTHTAEIRLVGKRQMDFSCTCGKTEYKHICKHVVASLLALRRYLETNAQESWQYRLSVTLQANTRKTTKTTRQRYIILFGLKKEKTYDSVRFSLIPYTLRVSNWSALEQFDETADPVEVNALLEKNTTWTRLVEMSTQMMHYAGCLNLPAEGVAAYNMMVQSGRYYYETPSFAIYLPLLARMNVPVFLLEENKFCERIQLLAEPVMIEAALGRAKNNYVLQAGIQLNGALFTSIKDSLHIITNDPCWVMAGNYILPVKNSESLPLLSALPLTIPEGQEQEFRSLYLNAIAERIPIKGDVVAWEEVREKPVPRLYLHDDSGKLRANLLFAYGEHEVTAQAQPDLLTVLNLPDSWGLVKIFRQPDEEQAYYQTLTDPNFRLKRAGHDLGYEVFELRARAHPFDFLMHSVPLLTQAGFEIYGEDKLKVGKINRNVPNISLNVTSGLDWFDLQAVVQYGDQDVGLRDIYKALRKKEHYVKLADGSIGQIPETWLERYRRLFEMAEETRDGLRIADYQLPLMDDLLADAESKQIAPDFETRRNRLRTFDHIQPQQMPAGFVGELRPYQKVGVDWLHFLNEYGFGGCLADDMGLGKTIQVLTFLQSLREQGKASGAAALLVVPKSLITNWQREAARFTPGLTFHVYLGGARNKDVREFPQYDVILTTYGTMLRDIDLLRGYRFHYVILDESQAIKNPLSLSSRAARLLQAEHRLVMTGTPVENNTFELWSQFAFLNPGMLGNMDYFKREFASPIESNHDENTAMLLRQLVYPFIMRRTKEEVAPELPPFTERVLYTDMAAAQRKLYQQTRDRYRGILMGLIDADGIENVRMKILEGLLRLRQISIHPALVEPTYHAEVPKFELLFETLETLQAENHKALVFSQFVETLHMIRKELDARGVPYAYLDGQTQKRQEAVDRFQNDPAVRFFLISLKAGGVGLNLTAADYVIHLDPWWNPAVEMQASDRAHRIGQDKPVFVYKFITRDTVEEKILQLQERKRALVEQLITSESSFFKALTADDVKVLFS